MELWGKKGTSTGFLDPVSRTTEDSALPPLRFHIENQKSSDAFLLFIFGVISASSFWGVRARDVGEMKGEAKDE